MLPKAFYYISAVCLLMGKGMLLKAQITHDININIPEQAIYSGRLDLGGTDPKGERISVNNYYISMGNKPVIPISGEFHYSRYPHEYWDESIKKMKAGGITIISTYVFWILHEEEEGKFVWTGDKDLREFVELCKKNGMYVIVRIGPFDHGEIRNGGLPDWLLGKPLNIRSNDSLYLSYVKVLYDQIGKQLEGLFYKDGGPIIGIQIENEYQHSAAPWGITYPGQPLDFTAAERDLRATHEGVAVASGNNPYAESGNDHMRILKAMAIQAGMKAPLYTATGWGYAAIIPNGSIPVTAAYAYPFWVPKRDYSPFFLYKNMHANPDYAPVRYKPEDYPAIPAELGSGISLVYPRRPIVVQESFDAMINRCLGSGANGIGYYMYHSGSTPRGIHSFMNDEAYGLTKISYEYQSPIGEYGQVREGFHRLKLVHFFLRDFGDLLAPMTVALPANAATLTPENTHDLRYSVRFKGNSGFLFLNDFQDDTTMEDQRNVQIRIKTAGGDLLIPEKGGFNLKSGENAIFPFNFDLNGAHLIYATAQLLTKGDSGHPYYIFFTPDGTAGEFAFGAGVKVRNLEGVLVDEGKSRTLVRCKDQVCEFAVSAGGKKTRVLVVSKGFALKSYMVTVNGVKSVIFSDAVVLPGEDGFELLREGGNNIALDLYPKESAAPSVSLGTVVKAAGNAAFASYRVTVEPYSFEAATEQVSSKKVAIELPQSMPADVNDVYLTADYTGDTGMDFYGGQLVADNFYNGTPWHIGLRKFITLPGKKEKMVFYFRPMEKNASYLLDLEPYPQTIPNFGQARTYLKVNGFHFTPQYKTTIRFSNGNSNAH